MSSHGKIQAFYTKSGLRRFAIEVKHDGLKKYQVIRGDNKYVVEQKARAKTAQWDDMWSKKQIAEQARLEREQRALDKAQKLKLAPRKQRRREQQ